jgi:hypothetical protein
VCFCRRPPPLPWPPHWRGLFCWLWRRPNGVRLVGRPRSKDPRQHRRHPTRTGALSTVDPPPPGLAKLMPLISEPRAADAEASSNPLDSMGWASLAAGLLVVLITFFTSYSHIDFLGFLQFKVDQQIGIPLLLTAMAALVGDVKLASNHRCADQRARKREARERTQEAGAREREARAADRERYRAAAEKNKRLADIESRLDALLLSADSSSPAPPATDSN